MRSREQFKAYVYAKAEAEQTRGRKRRRMMIGSVAACCVCICVISAVFLMPQHLYDKSGDPVENDFAALEITAETAAPFLTATDAAAGATEAETADAVADDDFADANGAPTRNEQAPVLKSCLFSANLAYSQVRNSTVRTAFYEILDYPETSKAESQDGGRPDVSIGITAYYLKKPEVSEIKVDYSGEAVTVTVIADTEPIPFGAYVYYFTQTLDGKKYFGQPIRLEFKSGTDKDASANAR